MPLAEVSELALVDFHFFQDRRVITWGNVDRNRNFERHVSSSSLFSLICLCPHYSDAYSQIPCMPSFELDSVLVPFGRASIENRSRKASFRIPVGDLHCCLESYKVSARRGVLNSSPSCIGVRVRSQV